MLQAILDNHSYYNDCGCVMGGAHYFRKVGQEYNLEGQCYKLSKIGTVPLNSGRLTHAYVHSQDWK